MLLSILVFILLFQSSVFAQSIGPVPVTIPYTNYLASATIMLVMLGAFAMFIKKLLPGNKYQGTSGHRVKVLDRIPIEPTVSLYLIQMKDKIWLLSVGNKYTQVISDVTDLVQEDDYTQKPPNFSFQDILDRVVKKKDEIK